MSSNSQATKTGRSAKAALPKPSPKNPQKKSNRRRPRKRQNRARGRQNGLSAHLAPCTQHYAMALFDPFGSRFDNETPCIPDASDVPSYKFSILTRGSFSTGTQGLGYILVAPNANGSDSTIAAISSPTFAGSTTLASGAGVTAVSPAQFPWTSGAARAIRLVSMGVRIRYSGTELQRGGTIYAVSAASEDDALENNSIINLAARNTCMTFPVKRRWTQAGYRVGATNANTSNHPGYMYHQGNYDLIASTANAKMVIAVQVPDITTSKTFDWEIIGYYEAVPYGGAGLPVVSRSHADTTGYSWVRDFAGSIASSEIGQNVLASFQKYLVTGAVQTASSYLGRGGMPQRTIMY